MKIKLFLLCTLVAFVAAGCSDKPGEPSMYNITVTAGTNGTASADMMQAAPGTTVTLTAVPAESYGFEHWTVTTDNVTLDDRNAPATTFTMPAADVAVSASFITALEKHRITANSSPDGGGKLIVTVDSKIIDIEMESIPAGVQVSIEAVESLGFEFEGWDTAVALDDPDANPTAFTMPDTDVEIGMEFSGTSLVTDEGIQVGSRLWATRNVGLPGTFASSSTDPGLLYQWDRNTGWSATEPMKAYGVDGREIAGAQWDNSDETGISWSAENNPCPPGWRPPSLQEIGTFWNPNHLSYEWVEATATTPAGMKFTNANGTLFLPAAGKRNKDTGALESSGAEGYYWSSEESNKQDHRGAFFLAFDSSSAQGRGDITRATGYSVRCLKGSIE
jgi:uncharacterized protein (TIGR02145 family)